MFWLKVVDRLPPSQALTTPYSGFFLSFFFASIIVLTCAHKEVQVHQCPSKSCQKSPQENSVWQHGLATVVQTCSIFSPPQPSAFADHRFFAGFNNFRVKVASFPSLPWLPFCLCLSKCAVCLCVGPALISRIAHQLSPTVPSSLSPPLALSPTHFPPLCHLVDPTWSSSCCTILNTHFYISISFLSKELSYICSVTLAFCSILLHFYSPASWMFLYQWQPKTFFTSPFCVSLILISVCSCTILFLFHYPQCPSCPSLFLPSKRPSLLKTLCPETPFALPLHTLWTKQ